MYILMNILFFREPHKVVEHVEDVVACRYVDWLQFQFQLSEVKCVGRLWGQATNHGWSNVFRGWHFSGDIFASPPPAQWLCLYLHYIKKNTTTNFMVVQKVRIARAFGLSYDYDEPILDVKVF